MRRIRGHTLMSSQAVAGAGVVITLAAALAIGGCANNKPKPAVEASVYPTNYRQQIATLLMTALVDKADFRSSFIAEPVQMQVGDSQHYVVCVQLNGHNQHKDKIAIYLAGSITQFVDATPEQCGSAQYQPFKELAAMTPS